MVIFQKEHRLVFQRSFAVALLAVFLIHLLPSISEARLFEEKRETPIISVSVEITENAFLNGNDIDQMQDDFDWGSFIGINQGISLNFFDKGLFLRLFKKIVTLRLIVKEIKHVPIGGCLFLY